jgi:hypothetical protein
MAELHEDHVHVTIFDHPDFLAVHELAEDATLDGDAPRAATACDGKGIGVEFTLRKCEVIPDALDNIVTHV